MKSKKALKPLKSLVLIGVVTFASLLIWWRSIISPLDPSSQISQIFVIPKGQGIDKIGRRLQEDELIRSKVAFKIYVLQNNLGNKIQAGDFRLRSSMDLPTLAQELTHGTLDIWVTLLEGWRREEMAQKLKQDFASREADFDVNSFLSATQGKEGYLYPDTYLLPRDATSTTIAQVLQNTFDKKINFEANRSGLTQKQVVIMASIVEREVRTDPDRALVAGILIKRLQNDWPLQADATVQYAVGTLRCTGHQGECDWWPQNLTRQDIDRASSYNTYQNQGLPPAPIANPGVDALNAALNPKASEAWFYISDLKGNIHYATTIEEHNANIAKYLGK